MWSDYKNYPFTIGFQPGYHVEAGIYARHIMKTSPNAKVAIFYQNDDAGRDYANGFKAGLGPEGMKKHLIFETTYESTDPTIDSKIIALKGSGADALFMRDSATGRAGDPEGQGNRLAADLLSGVGVGVGRRRAQARRSR